MSSKWGWVAIVLFAGSFLTDAALAQGQGRRPGGMLGRGNMIGLLSNEAVQKEIGIGDAEKEKLTKIGQEYGDDLREEIQAAGGGGGFQDASAEERQKMITKFQDINQKLMAKHVPAIKEVLKPEQFTRLQQITWQVTGSTAVSDPDFVKALDLTVEQQQKIKDLNQEYQQKQFGLFGGGGQDNVQQAFAKMRELTQERDAKAKEVLSKEQQAKLEQVRGKPFDLSQLQQGGGGRPGRKSDN
jgi:Spy/CpxP family protein refolding chaperone